MKITEIFKSKKFKNTIVTLIEILVIAGVIMAILMTVQSKLKSTRGTGVDLEKESHAGSEDEEKQEVIDEYKIEVNLKKSVVVIYQYTKDKSAQNAIKVMNASVGKGVKAGKNKIGDTYTWLNSSDGVWNKYNSKYSVDGWFQSVNYSDKYSWTLDEKSYEALGNSQSEDANIKLLAVDAHWIYANCTVGTEVVIKKGKEADVIPELYSEKRTLINTCGWEPTDPEKDNPYISSRNGTITFNKGKIYIEKGSEVNYFSNLIVLNEEGKNITKKLKFQEFDSSQMGEHEVKYSFTTKAGTNLEAALIYKVIDTTEPIVKLSTTHFVYEVDSNKDKDLKTKEVKEAIEEMVEKKASSNEGKIEATTVPKNQLKIGNVYVYVVAKDSAGNIGTAQATVEIKVKSKVKEEIKDNNKDKNNKDKNSKDKNNKDTDKNNDKDNEAEKETTTKKEESTTVSEQNQNSVVEDEEAAETQTENYEEMTAETESIAENTTTN